MLQGICLYYQGTVLKYSLLLDSLGPEMKGHLSQKCQWCRPWGYRKIRGLHDWVDGMGCNEFHYKWPGWWFGTWLWFSISYMGCRPSHWRTHIFQDGFSTTNQWLMKWLNEMTEWNDWMNEWLNEWTSSARDWVSLCEPLRTLDLIWHAIARLGIIEYLLEIVGTHIQI
jgi:hypothetical protein